MKRSWTTSILIGALVLLFAALGVLQYHWLKQISDANAEKERERVSDQTKRFASDFNRELQNAYFTFQADADSWKKRDWTEFNERLDFWRSNAQYPELVTGFYFIPREGTEVLKYDANSRSFVAVSSPDGEAQAAFARGTEPIKQVDLSTMTLYLPIMDSPAKTIQVVPGRPINVPALGKTMERTVVKVPPRYGYVAIGLNKAIIDEQLVPALTEKYFPDKDYKLAFAEGESAGADANARLYDMRPDNIMMFSNRELIPRQVGKTDDKTVVLDSRVETVSSHWTGTAEHNGTLELKIKRDSKPRTSVFTATTISDDNGGTKVMATHSSGSIDAFMTSKLRNNLAIGLSLLLLTAGAVLAIIISSVRAKAAAQRQIDFVSSVSHEFRTPLAVIKSAGENLADGVTRDATQVNRYGELIKSEGNKLNAMVEQILEFAGANSGRQKLKLEPTPVADLVNSAIDECRPIAEDRGFTIETDIADGLPEMNIDRTAISQAIQNLVTNSIKYSNGERWVRVSASNGNGKVKISVEDRGIGISKSDLKQIFEPFFRAKDVVDAQIHGNGLGLSLVKKTVNAHGGEVTATSEIGKGSRFTISLPLEKI